VLIAKLCDFTSLLFNYLEYNKIYRSSVSSVGIAAGYVLEERGSIPSAGKVVFSLQHPDRLWGPHSLLSNGYREDFPEGKVEGA
jgi:hypothetical protein